jgi:tRNA (mo5U34)-methyltransferase
VNGRRMDPRVAAEMALAREWFYSFELPDGRTTRMYISDDIATIHETRLAMIFSILDTMFADQWPQVTALDVACHEGYFAINLAKRGCRDVLGIDIRKENIEGAVLMRSVYGLSNLRFDERDVLSLGPAEYGRFDVVLMLGLLYHLENPIEAIRVARAHTSRICLIETQIAPNLSGIVEWGSYRNPKQIVGTFAVVDESTEIAHRNREANTTSISLVPSLEALLAIMSAVGFSRVEVAPPPVKGNEQLVYGKRVLVAGYVD